MTQNQKDKFQRAIEGIKGKEERSGKNNLDKNLLREIAEWIKNTFK